jgi:sugar diacid utilization regulator
MKKYMIIETKEPIEQYQSIILSILSDYLNIEKMNVLFKEIIIYYQGDSIVSLYDIAVNMMTDILTDLRIYESYTFSDEESRESHISFILKKMNQIPIIKHIYLDDKIILKTLIKHIDQEHKQMILRKYSNDQTMLETIKVYLESNQNMILAAKNLYVHRNTLIQRIDKFYQVTQFDVRKFSDAYLIYSLIK